MMRRGGAVETVVLLGRCAARRRWVGGVRRLRAKVLLYDAGGEAGGC